MNYAHKDMTLFSCMYVTDCNHKGRVIISILSLYPYRNNKIGKLQINYVGRFSGESSYLDFIVVQFNLLKYMHCKDRMLRMRLYSTAISL